MLLYIFGQHSSCCTHAAGVCCADVKVKNTPTKKTASPRGGGLTWPPPPGETLCARGDGCPRLAS